MCSHPSHDRFGALSHDHCIQFYYQHCHFLFVTDGLFYFLLSHALVCSTALACSIVDWGWRHLYHWLCQFLCRCHHGLCVLELTPNVDADPVQPGLDKFVGLVKLGTVNYMTLQANTVTFQTWSVWG